MSRCDTVNTADVQQRSAIDQVCKRVFAEITESSKATIASMLSSSRTLAKTSALDGNALNKLTVTMRNGLSRDMSPWALAYFKDTVIHYLNTELWPLWADCLKAVLARAVERFNNDSAVNNDGHNDEARKALLRSLKFDNFVWWLKWLGSLPADLATLFSSVYKLDKSTLGRLRLRQELITLIWSDLLDGFVEEHIANFVRRSRRESASVATMDNWRVGIGQIEVACEFLRGSQPLKKLAAQMSDEMVPIYAPIVRLQLGSAEAAERLVRMVALAEHEISTDLFRDSDARTRFLQIGYAHTKTLAKWCARRPALLIRERARPDSKEYAAFQIWNVMTRVAMFLG